MFTKITIGVLATSGIISTTALTGMTPTHIELAAGPVRIETGEGHIAHVYLAKHSPFNLSIQLKNDRIIKVQF